MDLIDGYLRWLANLVGLILLVLAIAPLWPWPFASWPWGALGGFNLFLWVAMVAMDFTERRTGHVWMTKLGALFVIAASASLIHA